MTQAAWSFYKEYQRRFEVVIMSQQLILFAGAVLVLWLLLIAPRKGEMRGQCRVRLKVRESDPAKRTPISPARH